MNVTRDRISNIVFFVQPSRVNIEAVKEEKNLIYTNCMYFFLCIDRTIFLCDAGRWSFDTENPILSERPRFIRYGNHM